MDYKTAMMRYMIFPKYSSDFDFNKFKKDIKMDYIDFYQKNVFKMELYKLRIQPY